MKLKSYLPSGPQLSSEIIAVLLASVVAAYIISKVPALRDLVRQNSVTGPFS